MKAAARIIARILRPRRAAWPDLDPVLPAAWAESGHLAAGRCRMSAETVVGALSRVKLANPLWDIQRASIGAGFTATRDESHVWQPNITLLEPWLAVHSSRRPPGTQHRATARHRPETPRTISHRSQGGHDHA